MNKTVLSILAIAAAFSVNASGLPKAATATAKTQFKPATRLTGTPSLAGLGSAAHVRQALSSLTPSRMPYKPSSYDPSAIKEVKYAKDQQNPVFIKSTQVVSTTGLESGEALKNVAIQFLEKNKPVLYVHSPKDEFVLKSFTKDEIGFTHVKLSQVYMGKPVMGKEIYVHFSPQGTTVTGRWSATPAVGTPSGLIGESVAIANAINSVTEGRGIKPLSAASQNLLKYNGPTSELVVYLKDNYNPKDRWAYKVTARTNFINMYETMVDAQTGAVIHSNDISCTTGPTTTTLTDLNGVSQSLNTYQNGATYYMIDISRSMFNANASTMPDDPHGAIWTVDAQGASSSNIQVAHITSNNNTTWPSSATAASAHANGAAAYTYYKNTHNRNSIDGNGGTIISVINVTDDQGQAMDNAFWNGQLMAYGNGDQAFKPLAGGLDVAGHEMTHGVIQSTANLTYQDQSGALNESMADVFGAMIDKNNWTIGEQVCLPGVFPSNSLRDLSNPHNGASQGGNGWQPATMSEYVTGTSDHGGVHTNSGITNHAFYYFATAVTKLHAEQVYYRALTMYMTAGTQFLDARIAVVQAASDLYGATDAQAAKTAFDNVEIYDGTNTTPTTTPPVAGADWIILQSTDQTPGTGALYMVQPASTPPPGIDFHQLNTLFALNKVSVTDDGAYAFFVGTDYNVYSLTTDIVNPAVQTPLTTTGDWGNVAVSRDGNRLALVSRYQDTSIYIYDAVSQQFNQFHLYNPTFSSTTTNGPIYADALDWDPNGEFVIYDEKNVINNTGSATEISYWDIGLIKAWDKTANAFGTGEISKLVNSLPDGTSIGNPVFSKNHSDVVAFDVSNGSTYDLQAANLNTGDIGTILVNNSVPNLPSYSGADDQVTFTSDSAGFGLVGIGAVGADFINGNGSNPTLLTNNAINSVWFTKGTRANAQCAGLSADIVAQGSTDYPITSVVLDGTTNNATAYLWNTGATTPTITVTGAGTYNVQVTTSTGCTLSSANLTIGYPTGIHDVTAGAVSVYPVPSSDRVIIDLTAAGDYTSADVTDLTGRLVATQTISAKTTTLDIRSIDAGIYMLTLKDATNNKHYSTRIVKN